MRNTGALTTNKINIKQKSAKCIYATPNNCKKKLIFSLETDEEYF